MAIDIIRNTMGSVALLFAIGFVYNLISSISTANHPVYTRFTGVLVGLAGIIALTNPVNFELAVPFEPAAIILSVAALFLGLIPALIAMMMTVSFRIFQGGYGLFADIAIIGTSVVIGQAYRAFRLKDHHPAGLKELSNIENYGFSLIVQVAGLVWLLILPNPLSATVLSQVMIAALIIYPLSSMLFIRFILGSIQRKALDKVLKESQERPYFQLENINEASVISSQGQIVYFNDAFARLLNYSDSELKHQGYSVLFTDAGQEIQADRQSRREQGASNPSSYETILKTRDNTPLDVEAHETSTIFRDAESTIVQFQDISMKKRVREEQFTLSTALIQSPAAIVITDPHGIIQYVNPTFELLTGYSATQAIGLSPSILKSGDQSEAFYQELWQTIGSGNTWRGEFLNKKKTGELFWESASISPIMGSKGEITHYVAVKEDITRQKLDTVGLVKNERDLNALLDASRDMVFLIDVDGILMSLNDALAVKLGSSKEELAGRSIFEVVSKEFHKIGLAKIVQLKKQKTPLMWEQATQNGFLELSAHPVCDDDQKLSHIAVFVRDISEQRKSEIKQVSLQAQLAQSQKLEAIGTMASGIAHDFNNILQSQFLFAGIVERMVPDDDAVKAGLQRILDAGNRGRDLVKQILSFSRESEVELKPIKVQEILADSLNMVRSTLPSSIEMHYDLDLEIAPIMGDKTQLQQIILNLCNNAKQAIGDKVGRLDVSLQERAANELSQLKHLAQNDLRFVELILKDSGCGMDQQTIDKIYDPFFTTKAIGEGTGLGLAVVYGIVKGMKGKIDVSSELGRGTTFTVWIPTNASQTKKAAARTPQKLYQWSHKILLVDDEQDILDAGTRILTKHGFEIVTAIDGHAAWQLVQDSNQQFDLIISDHIMPQMSGIDLSKLVFEKFPKLPFILMSGTLNDALIQKCKSSGVVHMIEKPWNELEMLGKILETNLEPDSNQSNINVGEPNEVGSSEDKKVAKLG